LLALPVGWSIFDHDKRKFLFISGHYAKVHWSIGYDGVRLISQNCGLYGPIVHPQDAKVRNKEIFNFRTGSVKYFMTLMAL
jgi:hypothetical protein